jgi:hypothetical protein
MENETKGVIWAFTGWFALAAMGSAIKRSTTTSGARRSGRRAP